MIWLSVPIAALIGYVLGSIPVGLWVCRLYGVDIRTVGSGRTGGTNAWRAAGLKAAIPTIVGDAIKGAVAVLLVRWLFYLVFPDPDAMSVDEATLRTTVLNLSVALAGGFVAISPLVGGMAIIIAAFVIWWTRISSVATFTVGVCAFAMFLILGVQEMSPWPFIIYGVMVLAAVVIALRPNREKLREGKERVITLW